MMDFTFNSRREAETSCREPNVLNVLNRCRNVQQMHRIILYYFIKYTTANMDPL